MDAHPHRLLVAFESVLGTAQLAEIRHTIDRRLSHLSADLAWATVFVTNELVVSTLQRRGRCLGLRVYATGGGLRVEVDEQGSPGPAAVPDVARAAADRHGADAEGVAVRQGVDPAQDVSTLWCEIDSGSPRVGGAPTTPRAAAG